MAKKKHKRRTINSTSPQLIESIYQSGLLHFKQGEYEKAIRIWGNATKIGNPRSSGNEPKIIKSLAEAHFRSVLLDYKSKNGKDVISDLYKVSKYSSDQPIHLFHIGLAYHRMSKLPQAISFYTRAVSAAPEVERYRYHLGLAYFKNGEVSKSIETFETIKGIQGRIGMALVYISQSDYDRALDILKLENDNNVIKFLRGLVYLKKGEDKEAKQLLNMAADHKPENGVADYYLGLAHARTGAIPSAVKAWEDASRKGFDINIVNDLGVPIFKDKIVETYRQLVPRYYDRGDLSKVVKIWEKILEIDQEDTEVRKNLVHAYFIRGNDYAKAEKFTSAIKCWEKAWELSPKNIDIAHNLALAYEQRNEFTKATKYWKEALIGWKKQMSSSNTSEKEILKARLHNVHIHLVEIALQEDNLDKAILECIQAIRYDSNNVNIILKLANFYIMQRRFDMAIKQLLEARRLNPKDISILQEMAFAYGMNRDMNRSVQCIKEVLKIEPNNNEARDLLTNYYIENANDAIDMGKHKTALNILREGLDILTDSVDIQAYIGAIYLDMGDKAKAESAFQEAISIKPAESHSYIIVACHYLDKEMLNTAEEYFKKAIDIDPANHHNYIDIAIEYCEYDMFDMSHKYLEMAKNLRQGDVSIIEDIIKELLSQDFPAQAAQYANELINMSPSNPKLYLLAAEAYHLDDDNEEAQNALEKGMKVAIDIGDNETINEIKNFKQHIQYHGWLSRFGISNDFIGDLNDYDYDDDDDDDEDY
jgi:tetratricopeptide (TPR) repeat protein